MWPGQRENVPKICEFVERYYQIVTVWNRREAAVRKLSYFWVPIMANLQRNTLAMVASEGNSLVDRWKKPSSEKAVMLESQLVFAQGFFVLGNNFFD
jgi:hypothetical protein